MDDILKGVYRENYPEIPQGVQIFGDPLKVETTFGQSIVFGAFEHFQPDDPSADALYAHVTTHNTHPVFHWVEAKVGNTTLHASDVILPRNALGVEFALQTPRLHRARLIGARKVKKHIEFLQEVWA